MAYQHGAEVVEQAPDAAVETVESAIITLHGTAPKGQVNSLVKIQSPQQAIDTFGYNFDGFDIPAALEQIFAEGAATVIVINSYDPATMGVTGVSALGTFSLSVGATPTAGDRISALINGVNFAYTVATGNTPTQAVNGFLSALNANGMGFVATSVNTGSTSLTVAGTITGPQSTALNGKTIALSATGSTFSALTNGTITGGVQPTTIVSEPQTVTARKIKTQFYPLGAVVVKNSGGSTTYVPGTDYTIDVWGNITIINAAITDTTVLKLSYTWGDTSVVTASNIVGGISGGNVRTGFSLLDLVYNKFLVRPKLICAPNWNLNPLVQAAMKAAEIKFRAYGLYTFAQGTSLSAAMNARSTGGTLSQSDNRGIAQYGWRYYFHTDHAANILYDPTPALAGLISAIDSGTYSASENYSTSPSSHVYQGGAGLEFQGDTALSFSYTDSTCDATLLNSVGICTTVIAPGKPQMQWGNRNMSFPVASGGDTFISKRRVQDVTEDSIEISTAQFVDINMTPAQIDHVLQVNNTYIRDLIAENILVPGSALTFDPAQNNATDISNGIYKFTFTSFEYIPAEVIKIISVQNSDLLAAAIL